MEFIRNQDLTLAHLPDPGDERAVFQFAMTFDGYKHFGSFEECAKHAEARTRDTLTAIRNELFFEARSARHVGNDRFLEVYRKLLPLLEEKLKDGDPGN